jgi:DNA-binding beta-propeller fold protein YncE
MGKHGLVFLLCLTVLGGRAAAENSYVYVTNSAGTTIDVIDTSTNTIVKTLHNFQAPETVRFSPDGKRLYIVASAGSYLDVVDRETGKEIKQIPLSGHGNDMAVTRDGRWVLICINQNPGYLDFIDTVSLTKVMSIPARGPLHDIYLTADSKYAAAGSTRGEFVMVVDVEKQKPAWEVQFDQWVLPVLIESNPDGTGKRIFVELRQTNGFAVVDFATHKEIARINNPSEPHGFGSLTSNPCHGLGLTPDGKQLWVASRVANSFFIYSPDDLKLIGRAQLPEETFPNREPLGSSPQWVTFTPDSKFAYTSNSALKSVSVFDTMTFKEVARVPVGEVPSRISTLTTAEDQNPAAALLKAADSATPTLDFDFFKQNVAPIFLKHRGEHARCYSCHQNGQAPHYLQQLPEGQAFWTDDQLHRIYNNVSLLVVPGKPTLSKLLIHPLAPESGGDGGVDENSRAHGGGNQFENQADPDWIAIKLWILGQKAPDASSVSK